MSNFHWRYPINHLLIVVLVGWVYNTYDSRLSNGAIILVTTTTRFNIVVCVHYTRLEIDE